MDFVEETGHFCKALAAAVTGHEAAYGPFDVVHGHEWFLDGNRRNRLFLLGDWPGMCL